MSRDIHTAATEGEQTVPPKHTGWRRLRNAFFFSIDGLKACYASEEAFRQEVWMASIMIPLALLLPVSVLGTALMLASVLFVLIVEVLNTAVEVVVDRISMDHHVLSKQAKDMGSAAVLLSLLTVLIVWVGVLWTEFL
jgi:diacylglycerol kinase (ATP)